LANQGYKGKPFIEIQGQFVEITEEITDVQTHIDGLVARVETIEERVTANEDVVAGLTAQNIIYDTESNCSFC